MPIGSDATQALSASPNSSTAGSEITIADAVFCVHGKEVCLECGNDTREDNSLTFGLDFVPERDALPTFEYASSKDGDIVCKKHRTTSCSHTNFKKSILAANKLAKKR